MGDWELLWGFVGVWVVCVEWVLYDVVGEVGEVEIVVLLVDVVNVRMVGLGFVSGGNGWCRYLVRDVL